MRKRKLPPPEKRCQMNAGTEKQCRAPRRKDSEYCFFHEPLAQDERYALIKKVMSLRWVNPSDLHELLVDTAEAVRRKRLDPQRAYALACLVKQIRENLPAVDKEIEEHRQGAYAGWGPEVAEEVAWREAEEEEQRMKEEENQTGEE